MEDTQKMHVIAGLELLVNALSASRPFYIQKRDGVLLLILPPPCPTALGAPGEGLNGGLLEGSRGRHRLRGMPNRQNVDEPAYLFQNMKRSYPKAVEQITAACSSFSANHCFEKRNYVSL